MPLRSKPYDHPSNLEGNRGFEDRCQSLGAGGRLGSGRQWMSWLTLGEAVKIIQFTLANSGLSGPVNAVTPSPLQNWEFTQVLAKTLHRPALFPAPAFILRLALGEMADALLLASQRVLPAKLQQNGYQFEHSDLKQALTEIFQSQRCSGVN